MKKTIFVIAATTGMMAFGQKTGVNTTAPTNTLDVNGTARIRTLAENTAPLYSLVADANGVIGSSKVKFVSASSVTAANPVDMNYTSGTYPDGTQSNSDPATYKDLAVSNTITIPAGAKYGIFSSYSVPVGASSAPGEYAITSGSSTFKFPQQFAAYVGVGFYKNGTLQDGPTRKYSFPTRTDNSYFAMTTVSANYFEVIDNTNGTTPMTITYSLQGYLENMSHNSNNPSVAASGTVRFNMWASSGNNYNWGKSTLTNLVYQL